MSTEEKNWAGLTDAEREHVIAAWNEFSKALQQAFNQIARSMEDAVEEINRIFRKMNL